jgi:hypothetical protein
MKTFIATKELLSLQALTLVDGIAAHPDLNLSTSALAALNSLAKRFWGGASGRGFSAASRQQLMMVTNTSERTIRRCLQNLQDAGLITPVTTHRSRYSAVESNPGPEPTAWGFTADFFRFGMEVLNDNARRPYPVAPQTLEGILKVTLRDIEGTNTITVGELLDTSATTTPEQPENGVSSPFDGSGEYAQGEVIYSPLEGEFPPDDEDAEIAVVHAAEAPGDIPGEVDNSTDSDAVIPTWLISAMEKAGHPNAVAIWTGEKYTQMVAPLLDLNVRDEYAEVVAATLAGHIKRADDDGSQPDAEAFAGWVRKHTLDAIEAAKPAHLVDLMNVITEIWSPAKAEALESHVDRQRVLDAAGALLSEYPNEDAQWVLRTALEGAKKLMRHALTTKNLVWWLADAALSEEHAGTSVNRAIQARDGGSTVAGVWVNNSEDEEELEPSAVLDAWGQMWEEQMNADSEDDDEDEDDQRGAA